MAVDDHSADESWEILSGRDKVKLFKSEGRGTIDALKLAGAVPSGKKLAHKLISRKIKFKWVTENDKKIGKYIYGVRMDPPMRLRARLYWS